MKTKTPNFAYKTIEERLLSDENIFLSIYLIDSYIESKELLSLEDQQTLLKLNDIFDINNIKETIKKVKNRLIKIIKKDDYFEVTVYFKPKKYKEEVEFRPIHTASLIDQIAMVAMLQVLVYDVDINGKLTLSDLSRLLPIEFYGNKIACNVKELFKPWYEQYSEYSSKANELLNIYCETLEYKYEVNLDLEKFFPSINPKILYSFIMDQLPQKLNDDDKKTMKIIVKKLLFFKIKDIYKNNNEVKWYLLSPIDENSIKKCMYAKGLPQGLPHSYFMANLFMLIIREVYSEIFKGRMLFYVDDSVIFTNGENNELNKNIFESCINKINVMINDYEIKYCTKFHEKLPKSYKYKDSDFGVKVHSSSKPDGKSAFSEIESVKENSGEKYLRGLSRETSKMGFDMNTAFSDEEINMMISRTNAICKLLEKEIERIDNKIDQNIDIEEKYKVYKEKLLRYRKYFTYRNMILKYLSEGDAKKLKKTLICEINSHTLKTILNKFKDDILFAKINFVFKNCYNEAINIDDLIDCIKKLEKAIYGDNIKHSYISKIYEKYLKNKKIYEIDKYESLKKKISEKCSAIRKQVQENKYKYFTKYISQLLKTNKANENNERISKKLFEFFNLEDVYNYSAYIIANTNEIERMLLNCLYSYLFYYEVDDKFILAKRSRDPIEYAEIRVLVSLRNKNFNINDFISNYESFVSDEYRCTADYSLLQVLDIFRIFVSNPEWIDRLTRIHKYCCDTWKNGSKYLHFYTLHNQEHAVCLIRTAIKLVHGISYFQMKKIDYFILFAACYLHDISMVTLPEMSSFYNNNNIDSDKIYSDFVTELKAKEESIQLMKKHLCDYYQVIDEYFEKNVRRSHAQKSAFEIRKHNELNFIEMAIREVIAQVSEAHGDSVNGIYYSKSGVEGSLINIKMIKILLRLSDLLDMSRYRISNIILNHNLENLNEESRFHWISHLITDNYNLKTIYDFKSNNKGKSKLQQSNIRNKVIKESLILEVKVLLSQTSKVDKKAGCNYIRESKLANKTMMPEITIICRKDSICNKSMCNFMCKWFTTKNNYLFEEFATFSDYLNNIKDYFYASEVIIKIKAIKNTDVSENVFDYLRDYVNKN